MIHLAMLAIDKDIFLNLIDIGMKACRCEFLTFHPVTYIMEKGMKYLRKFGSDF